MKKNSAILTIFGVAIGLSLVWLCFLKTTSIQASYGESNFQANLIRADQFFYGPDKPVVLVGTSITGRLLPEFFKEQGLEVYNLGLDGCTPCTGLELVLKKPALPKIVLLEVPGFLRVPTENDSQILDAIGGFTFKLGRFLPIVRASSRPSAILYSILKKKNDAHADAGPAAPPKSELPPLPVRTIESIHVAPPSAVTLNQEDPEIKHLLQTITALTDRKVEVILMRLPAGNQKTRSETDQPDLADRLSTTLSLKILDVASTLHIRGVTLSFSDGLHMRGPSAREAAKVISEGLKKNQGE